MKKQSNSSGTIAIEASIALTLFIFFVLALYSFFAVFEVQGKVSNAVFQSSQSLSVDPFAIDKTYVDFDEEKSLNAIAFLIDKLGMQKSVVHDKFVTKNNKWFQNSGKASNNKELARVVKNRFIAYLTADGTESAAEALLKKYRVHNGLKGMNFNDSQIDSDGNITVCVKYQVDYVFDCPTIGIPPMTFKQSSLSHMWREKSVKYVKK
jgi:hypothetical protein